MDLWRDISGLTQQEFESELDAILGAGAAPAKKARASKKKKAPSIASDDRPGTRIAHQLRERAGLADDVAAAQLTAALVARGTNPAVIPNFVGNLDAWIDVLLGSVADSVVMTAAKKLG